MASEFRAFVASLSPDGRQQFAEAIHAAFREGYVQGVSHPRGLSVLYEADRIGWAFWRRLATPAPDATEARGDG